MLVKNKKIRQFVALCLGVALLILLGIRYGLINLDIPMEAPADGSLVIKVQKSGYAPFDTMTIKGAGFDKDAATSVIFDTVYRDEHLVVPALEVTANSVTVAVPPVDYEETNKSFNQDLVLIMVVQMKKVGDKLVVKSSNKSEYFEIYEPTLPSAYQKGALVPTGTVTQLVMSVAVQSLKSANAKVEATNPKLKAALVESQKGIEQMMANIEKIKKDPQTVIALKMSNGKTANFGLEDVTRLDALYSGYLGIVEKRNAWLSSSQSLGSTFVESAHAASSCQADVMNGPYSFLHFDSVARMLCNVIEYQKDPEEKESNLNKFGYAAQIPVTIGMSMDLGKNIAAGMSENWLAPRQIMVGTALSMASDLVFEGKIPGYSSLIPIGQAIVAEVLDKKITTGLLGKAFFSDLLTAAATYDLVGKIITNEKEKIYGTNIILLDSNTILKNTYDILKDTAKNPENLLFLGRALKDGVLMPFTYLRTAAPDESKVVELAPIGVQKGGYSNAGGEPITQTKSVSKSTPVSSPAPISKEEISVEPEILPVEIKSKATCAAGYTTCGHGCILSSSTCCPSGTISCPAGTTCTSDNMCTPSDSTKVVCKAGYEVCGKGCMVAGEICCPSGTISCPAGSTCTSDNRCTPITSGCEVGYEVCGDSCMIAGRTCCPGTSLSCPGGNTCTPDNQCLSPENDVDGGVIGGCLLDFAAMDKSNMTPEQLREGASCGFDF